MNKILKFEIDKIKLIEELSDSQNAIAEVRVCHTGMNSHELPISFESLKTAAPTLINKWLVAGWSGTDFVGHVGEKQRIIGFFPKENEFKYVEENGKIYLVAQAIVSKLYATWAFEVFEEENFRECSMEIQVLETDLKNDGFEWIETFIFNAVTVLGSGSKAACPGSSVEMVKFSEGKLLEIRDQVISNFEEAKKAIKIDNSKESSVSGNWSNPGASLYKPIMEASNKESLISESFLIHENGWENSPSTKLKYPHHVIRDGKLVVHIRGVIAAFQRLKQQGLYGSPLSHIRKHYRELGLSQENFMLFDLTYEDYNKYFQNEEGETMKKENKDVQEKEVEKKVEEPEKKEKMSSDANTEAGAAAVLNDKQAEKDKELIDESKKEKMAEDEGKEDEKEENPEDKSEEPKKEEMSDEENLKGLYEEMCEKYEDMCKSYADLEAKMSVYMQENEELKKFKADIEENEKMSKVEYTLNEASEFGMPKEKVEELRAKSKNFSLENIHILQNEIRAETLPFAVKSEKKESFTRIGLPYTNNENKKPKSVWDRI